MMNDNPFVDIVNITSNVTFGQNPSIHSKEIYKTFFIGNQSPDENWLKMLKTDENWMASY